MSEFDLIARHFARPPRSADVALGVGDDAAILDVGADREWVVSVDMMVEGRHFLAGADPGRLGHKLMAVNLSDLAAMGARPRFALLACAWPDRDDAWLAAFARGVFALADTHGVDVVGGDTTRGPRNLCMTVIGDVPRGTALRRSGAHAGDDVWVSGTLGDAMLALAALQRRAGVAPADLAALQARLECPVPRVALGQALRGIASAAIDVSDGLVGDLGHIVGQSGVGAVVDLAQLPRSVAFDAMLVGTQRADALDWLLAGGDDYELCFTAPADRRKAVLDAARAAATAVARIGIITADSGLVVLDERGVPLAALPQGFDHFAPR